MLYIDLFELSLIISVVKSTVLRKEFIDVL